MTLLRAAHVIVCAACLACGAQIASQATRSSGNVVGDLRIEELRSKIFGNTRKLRILLPPGYDLPENGGRVYPVLYLNDGQNLFDSTTAVFGPLEWKVDETIDRLVSNKAIPPMIVVGIDNAMRARAREYLPYPDEFLRPAEPNPRGKDYPEFLVKEVIPFVSSRYRVSHDRIHVGLGGSSFGGVATVYAGLKHSETFGLLLIESPSLYVDSAHVVRDAAGGRLQPLRAFIGVGTNEEGARECDPSSKVQTEAEVDVHRLERILSANGLDSMRLRVLVAPCAMHNAIEWGKRFPGAVEFLFRQ